LLLDPAFKAFSAESMTTRELDNFNFLAEVYQADDARFALAFSFFILFFVSSEQRDHVIDHGNPGCLLSSAPVFHFAYLSLELCVNAIGAGTTTANKG